MKTLRPRYLQVHLYEVTDAHYQYKLYGTDFQEDFDIRKNEKDTNSGKTRMMDFIAEKLAQFEQDLSRETKEIYSCDEDNLRALTKKICSDAVDLCLMGCNPEKCTCIITCPECHNPYRGDV